jgi:L-seryl-tRNA(Ser) seleniumtransferase
MSRFPARVPWTALYERSGLKAVSERVRRRPLVRRAERSLGDLRRTILDAARERSPEAAAAATWAVRQVLGESQSAARAIINATDVMAPRSLTVPLADAAIASMAQAAAQSIERDAIHTAVAATCELMGAEAAIHFSSPSLALLVTLSALATDHEVGIARHQVGTIYDFAVPDAIAFCGAWLGEVGTVDRLSEAEVLRSLQASDVAVWLHLAGVGFGISGETQLVGDDVPFALARQCGKPSIAVCDVAAFPGAFEFSSTLPAVTELVASCDLVLAPGDRFLGGPSCGILAGRRESIERVAAHPWARAALASPVHLAGLGKTIELLRRPETVTGVPLVQLAAATLDNLRERAARIVSRLEAHPAAWNIATSDRDCFLTEGRPERLPGCGISLSVRNGSAEDVASQLRSGPTPVWCTADARENRIHLNLRSILPRRDETVVSALLQIS